jgi:hypothetical protein
MRKIILSVAVSLFFAAPCFGDSINGWSLGVGYHNPPDSTVGLNFMHLWTNWALEFGVGYVGSSETPNTTDATKNNPSANPQTTTTYSVGGDINLKYLFSSGGVRPYLQGGVDTDLATTSNGNISAGASLTRPFGGFGIYFIGRTIYLYLSYLFINASTFQVGIGF